jgi:RNA polymerase sigma factor (sigma-70 family)
MAKELKNGCDGGPSLRTPRGNGEIGALLREFEPLVRYAAHRYEGRGAEFEDLLQEGCLALVTIARRTAKRQMAYRLASLLPAKVRDAAARMRRRDGIVPLETESEDEPLEFYIPDERAARDFEEVEIAAVLESLPDETDRVIARASMDGQTRDEIARALGVTKQAVAYRLAGIRKALGNLK